MPTAFGALLGREHARDGRQRARHEQRRADAHERAEGDELVGRTRQRRQPGRDAEDGGSRDQRAPAPEAVTERAGGQEQGGEREGVGIHDPLLRRLAGVEVGGDAREGVGEHRHAGHDHHEGQAHHGEDPTAVGVLGPRAGNRSARCRCLDAHGGSGVS
jgi:hypothetical protein